MQSKENGQISPHLSGGGRKRKGGKEAAEGTNSPDLLKACIRGGEGEHQGSLSS